MKISIKIFYSMAIFTFQYWFNVKYRKFSEYNAKTICEKRTAVRKFATLWNLDEHSICYPGENIQVDTLITHHMSVQDDVLVLTKTKCNWEFEFLESAICS